MCELLCCPCCGVVPKLPTDVVGTCYDIDCAGCGKVGVSIQMSDLMTIEEREAEPFTDMRYGEEYIERAKIAAIKSWNTRV